MRLSLIFSFIGLIVFTSMKATIINVPSQQPTIQAGINAASDFDTVLVDTGRYVENINFNGKNIVVGSLFLTTGDTSYISQTVIDGNQNGSVVSFENGEDSTAIFCGFTIQNGRHYNGGGIYCSGSSPLIDQVIIRGNFAEFGGGGIACQYGSNPIVINTTIKNNTSNHGGGIWVAGGNNPTVGIADKCCNIYNNRATNENGIGDDLCIQDYPVLTVYLDTFTVLNPDEGQIYPIDKFILHINTPYHVPIAADLFVSPNGDNTNNGLTPSTPFRNIWYAILSSVSSPVDSFKINILPGIYSPSLTGERTIHTKNFVSLIGLDSSSTIIDGDGDFCLIYCYMDSSFTISNLTIRNGPSGGIHCYNSNPIIKNNIISENMSPFTTDRNGGISCTDNSNAIIINNYFVGNSECGIRCKNQSDPLIADNNIIGNLGGGIVCSDFCDPDIINNTIMGDSTSWGTGISCKNNSSPFINGNIISGNTSPYAGGISCDGNSNPIIINNTITNNTSSHPSSEGGRGGGIYCSGSSATIDDNIISNNSAKGVAGNFGGGIHCRDNSNPIIINNTITGNYVIGNKDNTITIAKGGGIYIENSNPIIGGSFNNGNIFQDNCAITGIDLYSEGNQTTINAQYNTFNVYPPTPYFVRPLADFDVSNGSGTHNPITQDVYVSPLGSNTNDGLSEQTPLLNIWFALSRILPSHLNPLTIHLASGIYSPTFTGEEFPLLMLSYVSLNGNNPDSSILDAEWTNRLIYCINIDSLTISNITIRGGKAGSGGGIYCHSSNPAILNNIIKADSAIWGAGIFCTDNANPIISNNNITGNTTFDYSFGGGIVCYDNSNPSIMNNLITYNYAQGWAGGIACCDSDPTIINNTIFGNNGNGHGGGITCSNSSPTIMNCILWGNVVTTGPQVYIWSGSPVITYSDIEGGWTGIGNINVDPQFTNLNNFYLSTSSQCIDAGNPDTSYNDPEDPMNPGFALWPAMHGLRNDMGAYGGPGVTGWIIVGIEDEQKEMTQIPEHFELFQNYPNPFNPVTHIRFGLPKISDVKIELYNILGQRVITLLEAQKQAGYHVIDFDANRFATGVYIYRIEADNTSRQRFVKSKKMLLIK